MSERGGAPPWRGPLLVILPLLSVLGVLWLPLLGAYFWEGHEQLSPIVRAMFMGELWRAGEGPHTPWLPQAAQGYGWPFFTYYAPLGYYVAAALQAVPGIDWGRATQLSFFAALLASGLAMYGWTWLLARRARAGAEGRYGAHMWGLACAVVYMLAPFHLTEVFVRSTLATSWAWAWLPALLGAIDLSLRRPRLGVAAIALSYALLMLSHNITALWGTMVAGAYTLALTRRVGWPLLVAGGGALGAAMSACFWFPALALKSIVKVSAVDGFIGAPEDLHGHALHWIQFVVPRYGTGISDAGIEEDFALTLGVAVVLGVVLAIVGLVRGAARPAAFERVPGEPTDRARGLALLALLIVLLLVMSRAWPWSLMPELLRYIQFPWRLLLPAVALACALPAALSARIPARLHVPLVLLAPALLMGLIVAPRTLVRPMYPPEQDDADRITRRLYDRLEVARGEFLGCLRDEYLPLWVDPRFAREGHFRREPPPVHRLELLEGSLAVEDARRRGTHYAWRLVVHATSRVKLHLFDFPQWRLSLDGEPRPELLSRSADGLLEVNLPPGRHRMELRRAWPAAMRAGLWGAAAGWTLWLGLGGWFALRRFGRRAGTPPRADAPARAS